MSRSCLLASLLLVIPVNLNAQTFTWNGPLSGPTNWSAGNWTPGVPPAGGGTGVNLFFTGATTGYTATNDLGNPFVANSIEFGRFSTTSSSFASAGGNTIQLGGANPSMGTPVVGGFDPSFGTTINVTSTLNLNPSSGSVTFGGTGNGLLLLNGVISGSGPIRIAGSPIVTASLVRMAAANTFAGNTTLDGGHLVLGNASALGGGGNVLNVNSGWLGASTGITVANNVSLNGNLQVMALSGTLALSGAISSSGAFGLRLSGLTNGTTGLTLQGNNTYTGQTVIDTAPIMGQGTNSPVNNGVLTLSGANGAINSTSAIIIRAGGTLTSNDATPLAGGRINDNAGITMGSGLFAVASAAGTNYIEAVGRLTLESGHNAVTATPTTTSQAQITFDSLTRQNRATTLFRGTNLGNTPANSVGTIAFTTAPTGDLIGGGGGAGSTTISILPYAIGDTSATGSGSSLVTLDNGRIRPLNNGTEYVNTMTGGTSTTDNVRLTGSLNLNNATLTTRNALAMTAGTLSNGLGGALRLTSGTIFNSGAATISAPLDFGSQEAIFFSTNALTISGQISGSGGLTKAGASTLTLSNATNNYSGTTTINSGVISFNNTAVFGNSTAFVAGGTNAAVGNQTRAGLTYTGAGAATLTQSLTVNSGLFALNASGTGTLQVDGQISGAGGLFVSTTSNVILTNNNNNYTGQTRIFVGNLQISDDRQLGAGGAVDIGASTGFGMVLTGDWITSRHVNISFSSQVNTNANTWNQNGAFTGTNTATLTKIGNGTWNLNSGVTASTFSGPIAINAGRFNVNGFLATSASLLTIGAGATLGGTGDIDRPVTISGTSTIAPGTSPGTLTVSSIAAASVIISSGATFEFEINDATGTLGVDWDRLLATNSPISLPTAMTIRIVGLNGANVPGIVQNFNTANNYTWEFMTAPSFSGTPFGGITFTIDDSQFTNNNPLGGGSFSIVQVGTTGLAIQFNGVAVPEPSTLGLLGGLLATAGGYCRWRRRSQILAQDASEESDI